MLDLGEASVGAKNFLLDIKLLADNSWAQSTKGTAWEHLVNTLTAPLRFSFVCQIFLTIEE